MHLHNICEATTTDDDDEEDDYYDTDIKGKSEDYTLREMGRCKSSFLFSNGWRKMRDMVDVQLILLQYHKMYLGID